MEKTKRKFNVVDLVVVLAVLAVVAFVAFKLVSAQIHKVETVKYEITFYTEESTDYSLERVKVGDEVCDESNNFVLGNVTKAPVMEESKTQLETADGRYVVAPREGYSSAYVTFVGEGDDYKHGAKFDKGQYSVGQTVTIRAGDAKLYGRIYDIKRVE